MPFDAINLSVVVTELSQRLTAGKINKINQPEKDEIILNIYNGQNFKLLISANSSLPRIHLSELNKANPLTAPSFCMVLRKHLLNGSITKIWQQPFERVVVIEVQTSNELGDSEKRLLICEVVGKSSNIFLTDGQYKIIDCLKRIPLDSLLERPTMIGQTFQFLAQDKILPTETEKIKQLLSGVMTDPKEILKNKLMGIAYSTLNEIVGDTVNADVIASNFTTFLANLSQPLPTIVTDADGIPTDALAVDYKSVTMPKQRYDSLNKAYDIYFLEKDKFQRHNEKTKALSTVVKNTLNRLEKKIGLQLETLMSAQDNEQNKIFGELVLSNLYRIKKGDSSLKTVNFYDENQAEIEVPLDPLMFPQQNAQKYFKKYSKQKKTVDYTKQLLEENKVQLAYLKTISMSLKSPLDSHDIEDITYELQQAKLIKKPVVKGKVKPAVSHSKPLKYNIDGFAVYVGKNNLQNEKLTFDTAKATDIWLHAQDIPSSHVIVTNPLNTEIPDNVIVTAAEIAAFFSEASKSSKVSVFYTQKKNIKKPSKSPLGFVNILSFQTCLVEPFEHVEFLK